MAIGTTLQPLLQPLVKARWSSNALCSLRQGLAGGLEDSCPIPVEAPELISWALNVCATHGAGASLHVLMKTSCQGAAHLC